MSWFTTYFNIAINILGKTQIETSEPRLEHDCLPFIRAWKPLINFMKKDRGGIQGFFLHIACMQF